MFVFALALGLNAMPGACPPENESPVAGIQEAVGRGLPQGYRFEVKTEPAPPVPGKIARYEIRVFDPSGAQVKTFDDLHSQTMHFILASEDLVDFQHLHPVLGSDGTLVVETKVSRNVPYDIVAEFDPAGVDGAQTNRSLLTPAGGASKPSSLSDELATARTSGYRESIGSTKVSLDAPKNLRAGSPARFVFSIAGKDGKPATDLEPLMGMPGHMIVFSEDRSVFQHLHGESVSEAGSMDGMSMPGMGHESMAGMSGMSGMPGMSMPGMESDHGGHGGAITPKIGYDVTFPSPGRYKVFGQFKRGGKVVTADFAVEVR